MLGKMIVAGLVAAILVGSVTRVYAQVERSGQDTPSAPSAPSTPSAPVKAAAADEQAKEGRARAAPDAGNHKKHAKHDSDHDRRSHHEMEEHDLR